MTRRWLFLAALLSVAMSDAALAQPRCPTGTKLIGVKTVETQTQIIKTPQCQEMTAAEKQREQELDAAIAAQDVLVRKDRATMDAWRKTYLPQVRGQIEEWERLSVHARHEVYVTAVNAVVTVFLDSAATRVDMKRLLFEDEARTIKSAIDASGLQTLSDPRITGLLGQLKSPERVEHVLKNVENMKLLVFHGGMAGLEDSRKRAAGHLLIGVMHVFSKDPFSRLMLATGELGTALIWENAVLSVSKERVEQLSSVADSQLRAITSVSELYARRVKTLRDLRDELKGLKEAIPPGK